MDSTENSSKVNALDFQFGVGQADNQYVQFHIGDINMAVSILSIQEIIEPLELHNVPNAKDKFLGVANLRGEILGVIDLAKCCAQNATTYEDQRLLVFRTENGLQAAAVDGVDAVVTIPPTSIDKNPPMRAKVPSDFIDGVSSVKDQLVTIVNLKNLLENEELIEFEEAIEATSLPKIEGES